MSENETPNLEISKEEALITDNSLLEDNKIKLGNQTVHLDPQYLHFNERTLNEYFEKVGAQISYIGNVLRACQSLRVMREDEMKDAYDDAFGYWKEQGKSDKWAESNARSSDKYREARKAVRAAFDRQQKVQRYLDALNAANSNAHNLGHMLRKEMDKFGQDIYSGTLEDKVNAIVKDASAYTNPPSQE